MRRESRCTRQRLGCKRKCSFVSISHGQGHGQGIWRGTYWILLKECYFVTHYHHGARTPNFQDFPASSRMFTTSCVVLATGNHGRYQRALNTISQPVARGIT